MTAKPTDQAYYWSPEWRQGEAEAIAELEAGMGVIFDNPDDAITWLRESITKEGKMSTDPRLALLRVQLYTAMQQLEGNDLVEFWDLIREVADLGVMHSTPQSGE